MRRDRRHATHRRPSATGSPRDFPNYDSTGDTSEPGSPRLHRDPVQSQDLGLDESRARYLGFKEPGSVYTYMILQPPVTRHRIGHYCAMEVFLAFALFLMVLVIQLSLVLITGNRIHEEFAGYQAGLVKGDESVFAIHNTMSVQGVWRSTYRAAEASTYAVGHVGSLTKNFTVDGTKNLRTSIGHVASRTANATVAGSKALERAARFDDGLDAEDSADIAQESDPDEIAKKLAKVEDARTAVGVAGNATEGGIDAAGNATASGIEAAQDGIAVAGNATEDGIDAVQDGITDIEDQHQDIHDQLEGEKKLTDDVVEEMEDVGYGGMVTTSTPQPRQKGFAGAHQTAKGEKQQGYLGGKEQREEAAEEKEKVAPAGPACCGGAECAGQGYQCCERSDSPNALHFNSSGGIINETASTNFLEVFSRKPGGGGGGGAKGSKKKGEAAEEPSGLETACTKFPKGAIACAPPSAKLLNAWNHLDTDGDGRWTMEEAKEDAHNMGCKIGMPLEDVFRTACRGLIRDAREWTAMSKPAPRIPYTLKRRRAIPHAYFEWWRGIVGLCVHTDTSLCGTMISRGVFDAALNVSVSGSRTLDIDSAMGYCHRLVRPRGVCDAALPGSYVMHRSRIAEKCGEPTFTAGPRFVNPSDPSDGFQTLTVSYANLDMFRETHKLHFRFFMFLVLVLWYVSIVDEVRDIIALWDFICHIPVENTATRTLFRRMSRRLSSLTSRTRSFMSLSSQDGTAAETAPIGSGSDELYTDQDEVDDEDIKDLEDPEDAPQINIHVIDRVHQLILVNMAVLRSCLLVYLAVAGTVFLVSNRNYMDLLLNTLALSFIFEIDVYLFGFLVPHDNQDQIRAVKPIKYQSWCPLESNWLSKWAWGFTWIPLVSLYYVIQNDQASTLPVLEALSCACLKVGEHCAEAQLIESTWWLEYWNHIAALTLQ